jgi:hypothetical protein
MRAGQSLCILTSNHKILTMYNFDLNMYKVGNYAGLWNLLLTSSPDGGEISLEIILCVLPRTKLCHTIKSYNMAIRIHIIQKLPRVIVPILDEVASPCHPITPRNILGSLKLGVWNDAHFSEGENPLAT